MNSPTLLVLVSLILNEGVKKIIAKGPSSFNFHVLKYNFKPLGWKESVSCSVLSNSL